MWKCHKCGKPVFFAERKQSLGYDWHPECLRCEECGKRLNPGQHAEHKGVPYCHHPCYGALFGPQLFGHGTRVESHTSFGKVENRTIPPGPTLPRSHLDSKLKAFNAYQDGRSGEIRSREVNGRLVLEGALRIHWGVYGVIHLKEDDDQRTVVTIRKRHSARSDDGEHSSHQSLTDDEEYPTNGSLDLDVEENEAANEGANPEIVRSNSEESTADPPSPRSLTLPPKLDPRQAEWDELDELLQVERKVDSGSKLYQTMPSAMPSGNGSGGASPTTPQSDDSVFESSGGNQAPQPSTTGKAAIRRRPGAKRARCRTKLKRRCSINGHFYNRETSFFTPPHGSQMSVWVTSLVSTHEVINLILEKYKVDSFPSHFALFVVRDNGEQRRLRDDEYPLLVRVMLGPHEDVAKLYLMDSHSTDEISSEVAQFLNLTAPECKAILSRYQLEEERELRLLQAKFREMHKRIKQRMEELKVRL